MATLNDLLSNKEAYPDSLSIQLADGVTATLGDLRSQGMMQRDYSRKTAELAEQRRSFERNAAEWESARLDAEAKLANLAQQLMTRNPESTRDEIDDMLERDPIARKLSQKIDALESKLTEKDAAIAQQQERMRSYEQNYIADQHRRVLGWLKSQDPELNETELVNFARERYIPRLDDAHTVMTRERREAALVEKTRKEAMEEGYKKAKTELLQPRIEARRTPSPTGESAAQTFDQAAENALRDPDVLNAMQGQ